MVDMGGIFVKFSDYVDDIRNGKIYFNTLQYFINKEKNSGIAGQGDKFEGQYPVFSVKSQYSNMEIVTNCTKSSGFEKFRVFCITALIPQSIQDGEGFYKLTNKQKLEFKSFGCNSCITIFKIDEFIQKFENACKKANYEYAHGLVVYEDFYNPSKLMENTIKDNPLAVCFRKDKRFGLQQEYRFIICENIEKPYLEIGDISDISKVCKNLFKH